MEPPSIWEMSDFDAVMFTFFSLAVLTSGLRLFVRGYVLRALGLDDALAVLATLVGGAMCAFEHRKNLYNNRYLQAVRDGQPVKSGPIVLTNLTEADRMTLLNQVTYVTQLALSKCAILAFYRRLTVSKKHHYTQSAVAACIVAFTIAFIVATFTGRDPPKAAWYPYDPRFPSQNKCTCETLAVANSSLQATFDIIILALPLWFFRRLELSRRVKLGLSFVYALGFFSLVTTLIRLSESVKYLRIKDFVERRERLIVFSVWTTIETSTALMCANLPALSAFFKWAYHKQTSRTRPSQRSGSEGHLAQRPFVGGVGGGGGGGGSPRSTAAETNEKSPQGGGFHGILRTTQFSTDVESGVRSLHLPIQNP